jgi:hypothetical protein
MRRSSIATALVVLTAGLTASALRRMAQRRRAAATAGAAVPTQTAVPAPVAVPAPAAEPEAAPVVVPDAVVLQFTRPAAAAPAGPARCGDSGGLTRAGAPCAARATSGGRCHHHPIAA